MSTSSSYQKLQQRFTEIALVNSVSSLLNWDLETYLPQKATPYRAEQLAYLAGLAHRLNTDPEIKPWFQDCNESVQTNETVNLREWQRQYGRAVRLPQSLVEEFKRTCSLAREAWLKARKESLFKTFQPFLEKIILQLQEMADRWGYIDSPYNALLEEYEPGVTVQQIEQTFLDLANSISKILPLAQKSSAVIPLNLLKAHYPIEQQQKFNEQILLALGFDIHAGRIDTTAHPFCTTIGPNDCRLTTRYDLHDFTQSLFGILHEAGHGLYEQGLSKEYFGLPLGQPVSLGIHESQSRLWENQVGRSRDFWAYWYPIAQNAFPHLQTISLDHFWLSINRVTPSFIRVEADEVTYNLHIILRFEIEKKLIENKLKPAEIPEAWNARFKELFGLEVPNDSQGCLQDIHWSLGAFGYFPTYTLGNLNAAQLFHTVSKQLPELKADFKQGHYQSLLQWLREHVHQQGMRFLSPDLMKLVTGEMTQSQYFCDYLKQKFLSPKL